MPIGHDKLGQFVAFYKGFVDFLAELREFGHFQSPVKYRILPVTKLFPKQFTKNSSTFGVDVVCHMNKHFTPAVETSDTVLYRQRVAVLAWLIYVFRLVTSYERRVGNVVRSMCRFRSSVEKK